MNLKNTMHPARLFPVLAILVCFSCQNKPGQEKVQVSNAAAGMPPGFEEFYQRFHEDSLYQIAHIVWPLAGETGVQEDSSRVVIREIEWLPENWRMHRPVDFASNNYRREIEQVGEVMIIERIFTKVGNFGLERRFAKSPADEWELIFYGDMRER